MIIASAAILLLAGPLSKFDDDTPDLAVTAQASIWSIERCLIDVKAAYGPPITYSQPDRPNEVQLLWTDTAISRRRVDLKGVSEGTVVKAWQVTDEMRRCVLGK